MRALSSQSFATVTPALTPPVEHLLNVQSRPLAESADIAKAAVAALHHIAAPLISLLTFTGRSPNLERALHTAFARPPA
jgi:hypothetical protein